MELEAWRDRSANRRRPFLKRWPARVSRMVLYAMSLALDCFALVGAYVIAMMVRGESYLDAGGLSLLYVSLPIFIMFEIARQAQCVETLESLSLGITRALSALAGTAIFLILLLFLTKTAEDISRAGVLTFFVASAILIIAGRIFLDRLVAAQLGGRTTATLLIQDGVRIEPEDGCDMFDATTTGLWPDLQNPNMIAELSSMIADYDRVVVSCCDERRGAWATFLKASDVGGEIAVDIAYTQAAVAIGRFDRMDTLVLSRGPMSLGHRIQKRAFDLLICIPLLLFLSPLLIIVALLIRRDSPGPVLFRQLRIGRGNRHFMIYKFRSMRIEAQDADGTRSAGRDDDRITPVGRFIRRTSIDELPQLFNVLLGDMSLVGPRPHALGSTAGEELFWEVTERYWLRHALKPGITGLAQIRGLRGATDRREDLEKRLRADLEYLTQWSVWRDFLILLATFRVLVHDKAY